ncbi:hypothetical protein GGS24DRAFT_506177 [Hypoxylon argillaceum]|nr:hypothetical protein GGS24DRAFT_506177 [Hypoxylon argillaceum]
METRHSMQGTKRRHSGEQVRRVASSGRHNAILDGENALVGVSRAQQARSSSDEAVAVVVLLTSEKSEGRSEDYFRDLYSTEPDFFRLGLKYPEFGAMLRDGVYLDFTDPAAVMQLTKTLLQEDFGLEIHLPPDRLCPPVPNRHNYLLWLKDLLDSTSASYLEQYEPERRITGLDIGTGASLIYPLLGCIQRPAWHFVATDIDAKSITSARANARANNLESRIRIVDRAAADLLIPLDDLDIDTIDFAMTNPPFYVSDTEMLDLATQKSQPPHSACTGAPIEMVCEGGEVRFVERMIDESLALRGRVQWYTAMLGKQSSLDVLIDMLKKHKINNFVVTNFIQGSKTRRWALGWSFLTRRPSLSASRGCGYFAARKRLPPVTEITIYKPCPEVRTDPVPLLKKTLCDTIEALDLPSWSWDEKRHRGVGFAEGNIWSRASRRKRARESAVMKQDVSVSPLDVATCAFGFSVSIQLADPDKPGDSPAVLLRWLQGDDASLFESFAGVVQRCLRKDTTHSG